MKFFVAALLLLMPFILGTKQIFAQFTPLDDIKTSENPVVVELFTSQSCSSCPPADKVLTELSQHENIITLGCHVTYWNHLHWKDTESREFCTQRQRFYSAYQGSRRVYTPQMIVNGVDEFVGSNRASAKTAIEKAQKSGQKANFKVSPAQEGAFDIAFENYADKSNYTLWLISYKKSHVQEVPRGENRGRTLSYTNPVQTMNKVGAWDGEKRTVRVQIPEDVHTSSKVLIIQEKDVGRIIGAARI